MADTLHPLAWEAPSEELDGALRLADTVTPSPEAAHAALKLLRAEVLFRWQQRTALSFRLQDLRAELVAAGFDDQSPLYQRLHDLTATAEAWMHPGTLDEATAAHIARLQRAPAPDELDAQGLPDDIVPPVDPTWIGFDLAPGPDVTVYSTGKGDILSAGQLWRDVDGHARICGVVPVSGTPYAVLLRTRGAGGRKRRPFLFPVESLLRGDDGWKLIDASPKGSGSAEVQP